MDTFSAAVLFLGGMALYSGYSQYKFTYDGDRNKTTGPVTDQSLPTGNPQIRQGMAGVIGNGVKPITQPNKARHALDLGDNPFANLPLRGQSRPFITPGYDLFPDGRGQVGAVDTRIPVTDSTTINAPGIALINQRLEALRPETVPHPDRSPALLYPTPVAGIINQWKMGTNGQFSSTSMRYDKKAAQFHDRSTTVMPGYWADGDLERQDNKPAQSLFWAEEPGFDRSYVIKRGKPVLKGQAGKPKMTNNRSANLGYQSKMNRVGGVYHEI